MSREVKVGVFVLLGLVAAGAIIFLIGDNRSLFDSKATFHAQFDDVQGLKQGATIRMGGVDIGTVSRVRYPDDLSSELIEVEMRIVEREARRLRTDSRVRIAPKGLLGDKMLTVTPGSGGAQPVEPGSVLPSAPPEDFMAVVDNLKSLSVDAQRVLHNLEQTTGVLAEERFSEDLRAGVAALSHILQALDSGEGYAARLLHDPKEAQQVSSLVANLERSTGHLDEASAELARAVAQVNRGPGLAHEVLYGHEGARALAQLGSAAEEVRVSLQGVREGSGLARGVLYGDGPGGGEVQQSVAEDMASISSDLAAVVRDVREGKGTLGALLVDPSVYEDLKMLLGNVQRNRALRALVRYAIQRDDGGPPVEVTDPDARGGEAAGSKGPASSAQAAASHP